MPAIDVNNVDGDTLWPAPSAYQFIRVIGGDLTSTGDAGEVSLKSNTTIKYRTQAMTEEGRGIALNVDPNRTIDCSPGEALKLGVTGVGVTIKGSLEIVVLGRPDNSMAPIS